MNFETIWSQYQSQLKGFLHAKVSDPDEVDDLLQNIMLKIYQKHHTVKSDETLKSWLFQVANNSIIDYYRAKARALDLSHEPLWYEQSEDEVTTKLANCVEPFIKQLPHEERLLLTHIDIDGRSQKHYAEELGVSYSTLKSRVQKARSRLHKLFTDCCHFSLDAQGRIADYSQKPKTCEKC